MERLFIIGNIHSGTTLLKEIFQQNNSMYTLPHETHFFSYLDKYEATWPCINKYNINRYITLILNNIKYGANVLKAFVDSNFNWDVFDFEIEHHEKVKNLLHHDYISIGNLFFDIVDILARLENKIAWVEKSPLHQFFIKKILKSGRKVRFIYIVRDPRDIIASRKLRSRQNVGWKPYILLKDIFEYKLSILKAIRHTRGNQDICHFIKYEDIILNPIISVQKLNNYIGIDLYIKMADVRVINSSTTDGIKKGFNKNKIGRYIDVLHSYEVQMIQLLLAKEINRFKYSLICPKKISYYSIIYNIFWDAIKIFMHMFHKIHKYGYIYIKYFAKRILGIDIFFK